MTESDFQRNAVKEALDVIIQQTKEDYVEVGELKRIDCVPLRSFNKVEMFKSGLEQNQSCYLGMLYSYLEQNFDMDRVTVAGSDEHSMQVG
ncbi:hypothetical protein L5D93_14370 [Paenibacillus thiaminolyticus]|nr:hypothetical protein [Paenibacillus thiaminolyticus]